MNQLDIIILVVVGLIVLGSYIRGFVRTLFSLLSMVITGALTYFLYPMVTKFIMTQTGIYDSISEFIDDKFNLQDVLSNVDTKEAQLDFIGDMELPDNITDMLESNNNPEMFDLLDASNFRDYISGSLATIVLNVLVFVALFIVIYIPEKKLKKFILG
jgi:hypothetical protein